MNTLTFPSLADFHRNRRLKHSDTLDEFMEDSYDFGVWWLDATPTRFRLTWIGPRYRTEDSAPPGELYLVSLGAEVKTVELLCVIPPTDSRIEANRPESNVREILKGWEDVCGEPNSIDWVRDRVAEALRASWATGAVPHV